MLWTIFVILLIMWALGLVTYVHDRVGSSRSVIGHRRGSASGQSY